MIKLRALKIFFPILDQLWVWPICWGAYMSVFYDLYTGIHSFTKTWCEELIAVPNLEFLDPSFHFLQ